MSSLRTDKVIVAICDCGWNTTVGDLQARADSHNAAYDGTTHARAHPRRTYHRTHPAARATVRRALVLRCKVCETRSPYCYSEAELEQAVANHKSSARHVRLLNDDYLARQVQQSMR